MRQQHDEAARVKRWRLGYLAAAERQRRLLAEEGPRPEQAVAEALSALSALAKIGDVAWATRCREREGCPPGAPAVGADPAACEANAITMSRSRRRSPI